jgi:DNA helicase-2/ATP-dependent DNA helicase PcrA
MTDARHQYPWLEGFSDEQVSAAIHERRHALVSAAPGSGKTKMVIGHCGVLLARGVKPDDVLGLAFNVDAAKEVNNRLAALPLPAAKRLKFRTIHSFCKEVLEVAQEEGLLPARELITSDATAAALARQALAGENGNPYDVEELKVATLRQGLTMAKASMIRLSLLDDHEPLLECAEGDDEVATAMLVYERMREEQGLRTFDDLIYDLACLFEDSEDARKWAADEFAHIIVDEYQDVDDAQQLVILTLRGTRANLFVVGDEDQCIYGWRGANLRYMMQELEQQLGPENVTRYQLSQTFRYGHEIAVAANSLIRNNVERPLKMCVSHISTPKSSLSVRMASTRNGDRYWPLAVMQDLKGWTDKGRRLRECAVLVRTYEMAAPLEMHLIRERVPYTIEGRGILGMSEVKAINAYAIMSDPEMFEACGEEGKQEMLACVLSSPGMFLPRKFIERLSGSLANASLQDVPGALRAISEADGLRPFQVGSLRKRAALIEQLGQKDNSMSDIASTIWTKLDWRSDVQRRISDPLKQSDRLNVINLMAREVSRYESVEAMLDAFSERMEHQETPELMRDPLLITSIHKAKGLEFPMVLIPGFIEGQFPHQLPDRPVDMEAERRLAYVGITRAVEQAIIFAPNDLELANRWKIPVNPNESRSPDEAQGITSRFLYEIEPEAVRAARTWFYGEGQFPMVDTIIDYAQKAGKPVPGAHTMTIGRLTDQPLATEAPAVAVDDYDFQFDFS